jgi:hypothetical protein
MKLPPEIHEQPFAWRIIRCKNGRRADNEHRDQRFKKFAA